jgi:hypothetical protein
MSIEGPTKRIVVQDNIDGGKVACLLISRSAAFEVTPLPDGEFAFIVKDEGHAEAVTSELGLFPVKSLPIPTVGPTVTPSKTPARTLQQAAHDPNATQEELDRLERADYMDMVESAG